MKVTGFSFIKNAVKYQYPIVEAVQSILPLCDEVVVAVGASDDGTRELVAGIHPTKIRIIDTVWDENLKEGGRVLASETDKAFKAIAADSDWCIYIQGDEVMHESGHAEVRRAMERWKDDERVDGLLFKYLHFFGSYEYVGVESHWYRAEIRVIKNDRSIYSYRDAQGFRKGDNKKLQVKVLNAFIYHYGWVQDPRVMKAKIITKDKIYHGHQGAEPAAEELTVPDDYAATLVNALQAFKGKHPLVMQQRIANAHWTFNYQKVKGKLRFKDHFKNWVEKLTGKRPFDYNNYKII